MNVLLLAAGIWSSGCATQSWHANLLAPEYQPDNIFAYPPALGMNLQRVAVLPLTCDDSEADLPAGCEALNPIMLSELAKLKKLEIVPVNSETLRSRTGRSQWSSSEVLPADFFETLHRIYGCDAVLFGQLTVFHAYAPVAVGWRFKLVDTRTRQILWAADEVFDAGQPAVLNAARQYQISQIRVAATEEWTLRNSPRQFGQYAAASLLATLPGR